MTTFRTDGFVAKPATDLFNGGKIMKEIDAKVTLVTADMADGDVVILGGAMPLEAKIAHVLGSSSALTAATDNDLGFYTKDLHTDEFVEYVNTAGTSFGDVLFDGVSLATAKTYSDILRVSNASLDTTKNIAELTSTDLSDVPAGGIYVGIKFNTKPSANGNLNWQLMLETAITG